MIGVVYNLTGNYPKALETLLQTLKLYESINNKNGIIQTSGNIGMNYSLSGDYKKAIKYRFKAMDLTKETPDDSRLILSLIGIGDSYEKLNKLDSALIYTQQGYALAVRLNDTDLKGYCLTNLGNIYSKMDKGDSAMYYYRRSLPNLEKVNNSDAFCEAALGMATQFKKSGVADSALFYARKSMQVAEQGGFTKRVLDASNFLSAFYEGVQRLDSAYAYQKITITAKDSLFSQEKENELRNLRFDEQVRQQEIEEAVIEARETRSKNIQMGAIGVFIPTFFGVILFFSRRKTKPKTFAFMGMLALLLFFEFIALFIHPYIEVWTHHTPVLMLLILVALASILVPLHHKLEHWVKQKLAHKTPHTIQ